MIEVLLARVIIRDGSDRQYIYLAEREGNRVFPIVIGSNEAWEIHRVLHHTEPERPMTHQLALSTVQALGAELQRVDIVDLRKNTFYAQVVVQNESGDVAVVDARPSDAIALALRARCKIRVAETVLEKANMDA